MDEKKFAIKETVSAEEVKMLRKKLGLTQRDFAGLLGCSKPTVERLEREGTATKGPMALLMKLLDRDAEYIQTLMIPPRELPVRIWYMYKDTPCTLIDVDEMQKIVHIRNYVDNIQFRAFGIKENPTIEDYNEFLESRCFPRTRDKMKLVLRDLGIPFYDPYLIWYKADYTGYEGLAEYMISHLLIKSTLKPEEFVRYDLEEIKYKRQVYQGVKSRTFLSEDWQIITLERLFQKMYGNSLNQMLWKMDDAEQRLRFLEEQVERMTGLRGFGIYLNKLLTIDAIFLNEDRHTHNIAVLMNGAGMFKYCPIFDNGGGLLSDTILDYPLGEDTFDLMETVWAKTVSTDFDEQLDVSEHLYGCNLKFFFTKRDVDQLLEQAKGYSDEVRERVQTILHRQIDKYAYLKM